MNSLYPIFLKLENKSVLVVGGGKIAEQKVRGLVEAKANVTVIAPQVTKWIEILATEKKITLLRREYLHNDVEGYVLVFAATNNSSVHQEIFNDAVSLTIPVNVVDVPELCNFYLASLFQKGDLKVAVSTNGKSPALGKVIRDKIAEQFGNEYPELLDTLGGIRSDVHSAYSDPDKRKEVLEKIVEQELKKITIDSVIASEAKQSPEYKEAGDRFVPISSELAMTGQKGKIYLVGAGPGDPELISVKGLRLVKQADVIVYDALVRSEMLTFAKVGCERLSVGKRAGHHSFTQEEINTLLIAKAKEGKMVVRLKGGDPFIFGRGGEEMEALRNEGIDFEIVPGITAGIGVPSSLGIPLTQRGTSSNVAFVTGSERGDNGSDIDWSKISSADTIVVYMGVKTIRHVVSDLLNAGRSPETLAVVIFGGTTPQEIIIHGTLNTIAEAVEQVTTSAPGIIVIGDVVGFLHSEKRVAEVQN